MTGVEATSGEAHERVVRNLAWLVFFVAFVARVAVVLWSARFPAAADGLYYETLADRLARGLGYTWAWPDGAVTYAAHYPVGLPALVASTYVAFGRSTAAAMIPALLTGAFASVSAFHLLRRAVSPARAVVGATLLALHPALLPYTGAIMTEGLTASLVVVAAHVVVVLATEPVSPRMRTSLLVVSGLVFGIGTLVRPQTLLFAPPFAFLASATGAPLARRVRRALLVTVLALATCAPWTVRNCVRMDRCALVSVNGGWNLLIGAETTTGAWQELVTPDACKEVWAEAEKDACFGRVARARILSDVPAFLARAPSKWAATFDYFGAAPWYFHTSNPAAFDERAKVRLGTAETVVVRILLLVAGVGAAIRTWRVPSSSDHRGRRALVLIAASTLAFAFVHHAWPAYFGVAALFALEGGTSRGASGHLGAMSAIVIALTALVHAAFFGAGRYGLPVVPFVTMAAVVPWFPARRSRA